MAIFKNICNRWNFMILKMKIFRWFKSCLIFWLLLPWAEITFSVHHHIFHVNDINLHIEVKVMIQIFAFQICCWFKYFDPRNRKKYLLYTKIKRYQSNIFQNLYMKKLRLIYHLKHIIKMQNIVKKILFALINRLLMMEWCIRKICN